MSNCALCTGSKVTVRNGEAIIIVRLLQNPPLPANSSLPAVPGLFLGHKGWQSRFLLSYHSPHKLRGLKGRLAFNYPRREQPVVCISINTQGAQTLSMGIQLHGTGAQGSCDPVIPPLVGNKKEGEDNVCLCLLRNNRHTYIQQHLSQHRQNQHTRTHTLR